MAHHEHVKQRKSKDFVYYCRHINGKIVTGTLHEVFPDRTLSRVEALEHVNTWNRLSCKPGEPCLWMYWLDKAE